MEGSTKKYTAGALAVAGLIGWGAYNQSQPKETIIPTPDNCVIAGNISASGEKIYHEPGDRYYDVTEIDRSAGERWFCSKEEAVAAGWRKTKR